MHIRTDTWHYRVWSFTYLFPAFGNQPYRPNLCQYCRRIVLMTIPAGLACAVMGIIGAVVFLIWEALVFASGTGIGLVDKDGPYLYRIPAVSVGRRRVAPQFLALGLWTIGLVWLFGSTIGIVAWSGTEWAYAWLAWFIMTVGPYLLSLAIAVAIVVLMLLAISMWRQSDTWLLIKAYAKAKKERICPRVEFVKTHEDEEMQVA